MATGADRGDARLQHAIRNAEERGDLLAWIEAVVRRYERQRTRGASEAELAALRAALLDRADRLRAGLRSRVGRLWAGQVVDAALGALLRDALHNPTRIPRRSSG